MKKILILLIIPFLVTCSSDKGTGGRKIDISKVRVESGLLSGKTGADGTVKIFLGIPYAAPPVGDLRWRAPQPPLKWEGVRKADSFCSACMQIQAHSRPPWTEEFMSQDSLSEDCLFLNIWTPAKTTADKLPVLVYIYGGGFSEGSGSVKVYDGEQLAKKGIVAITINYRLGILGFLAHPELTAESPDSASGNYALLDQVAALKWIHNNITAFGGDPSRVTIAGQSAGAMSVNMLIASPLVKGLFQRAIAQSGSSLSRMTMQSLKDAEAAGVKFMESKGAGSIADLRAMSFEQLTSVPEGETPVRFFFSNVDGYFLKDSPMAVLKKGAQNDVPTITGMNADEGSSNPFYGKMPAKDYKAQIERMYPDKAKELLALYPFKDDEEAGLVQKEAARDQARIGTWMFAKYRARTASTPIYIYYFDRAMPWPEHPEFGAFHTGEVPYVFNNLKMLNRPWEIADSLLAEQISSYWVNFIATGNPNGDGLPQWEPFDSTKTVIQRLGIGTGPIPIAGEKQTQFLIEMLNNK
jgi:para-nitrobenzyl esterase